MNKPLKIFLGLLTLLPWLYMVYFVQFAFKFLDANSVEESDALFEQMLTPHVLVTTMSLILLAIFIVHIVKNNQLDETKKLIWVLVVLFGNMIGMPVYWYMHIWRNTTRTV